MAAAPTALDVARHLQDTEGPADGWADFWIESAIEELGATCSVDEVWQAYTDEGQTCMHCGHDTGIDGDVVCEECQAIYHGR
jgi:hypothetical protein